MLNAFSVPTLLAGCQEKNEKPQSFLNQHKMDSFLAGLSMHKKQAD